MLKTQEKSFDRPVSSTTWDDDTIIHCSVIIQQCGSTRVVPKVLDRLELSLSLYESSRLIVYQFEAYSITLQIDYSRTVLIA